MYQFMLESLLDNEWQATPQARQTPFPMQSTATESFASLALVAP